MRRPRPLQSPPGFHIPFQINQLEERPNAQNSFPALPHLTLLFSLGPRVSISEILSSLISKFTYQGFDFSPVEPRMYIKEICLEGFKSYATRTVVSGFDPFFNAITGLNGSGKSNILDSICFVLGITNLQQVRATNLQELVYKQGQAGITKATVSIVFDNSDRSRSPLGYEDCPEITVTRQIVVGGRNKYLINGHLAQPSRVQTLFHSVQLNVNNPHFLIMQGRITKVLNMKPPEILSMLEEAAGTRMYEMKKEAALRTLEKKQGKVDEIDKLLDQEILPALEKLRKERMQYMQWANGNAELDRLKRFCVAYEFVQAEKVRDSAVSEVVQIKSRITELEDYTGRLKAEVQEMENKISALTAEKEAKMGGDMAILSEKVDALSRSLVKETSVMTNLEESLRTEEASAQKILMSIEDVKRSMGERDSAVNKVDDGASGLKKRVEDLTKDLDECEREFQGVLAGKSSRNDEKCLEDQLRDAKAAVGETETALKQLQTKISHSENELKEKRELLTSKREEAASVENELNLRKEELENLRTTLASITYEEGQMEALEKERTNELGMVQQLKDEIRILSGQLVNVQFSYRDPVANFDRSKVKGVVAKLIKVKDSSTMTALEVAAGGKLYNVVVDTENTGKQLLQNGDLRRRVTIIPLNKIQSYTVPLSVQQAAARLVGEGNAELALLLIGYEDEVKRTMQWLMCLESTFVCRGADAAKEVAFTRNISTPSVTLEGDIFQPSGLLTGGSRRGGGELLKELHVLAEVESKLSLHQERLTEVNDKIAMLSPLQKKFMHLKSQVELKAYDFSLFQRRAEQNEHHKLAELVKKLERDLQEAKAGSEEKQLLYGKCVAQVAVLEKGIKEQGSLRETRLKDLEKKIKSLKSEIQSASKQLKACENERERLLLEKAADIDEHSKLENQLATLEGQISALTEALNKRKNEVSYLKQEFDKAEAELKRSREQMKECDSRISYIVKEQQKLQQRLSDANLERKKMENEVKRMEMEQKDCSLKVDKLLEKHGWIATEKQLFGKSGTDYDFSTSDPYKSRAELDKLQAEQSSLEKRVNKKVMAMFEKAEDEYNDLISKKNIIENDKAKIKMVIEELDEKKKETLKVTWIKVNKDFGSIFSTLLPGTMAKLEPPEGSSFLDGLEVRVAFGSVWKQSLSELSGGQRSLLALSLILALLLFKPAPLYILDEVDAALDLSHTQNIGRMIKAHFPHSQFIVVSLKEGMFNNANVLFRTKFVDGVSTVTRTVASKHK
ncbi:putative structural maintenance of chromosomes protein [Dioscorea sansibarensis]